jgi:hypothetical protein
MNVSVCVTRPWPGIWARGLIVVIIFVIVVRWTPGQAIPLGLGGWLGGWLTAGAGRTPGAVNSRRPQ